ncbi:TolB-like translocation protein [Tenacibaculum amylolyticum]|uniref:hypothetical protein n=1 Tax=Tenacibaculum amylolyticum TaxID=104269 RepID=UPI003893F14E
MKRTITLLFLLTLTTIFSQNSSVTPIDLDFKQFLNCRDFTVSTDGNEAYFTVQNLIENRAVIVRTKKENGKWADFKIVSFTGTHRDIEPFLSPDNLRLYFSSNRPRANTKSNDFDIWYVERATTKDKWSEPINLGSPVNTSFNEFYPAVSANNNMYYTSDQFTKTRKDDILFAKWNGKQYDAPSQLATTVNSKGYEFNAYISPDESFLIYSIYKAKDGFGSGDLYISFKNDAGAFEQRKNLGAQINSDKMDYCPFYNTKTNTLYFTSKRIDNNYTPVSSLAEFQDFVNNYANGLSKIYKTTIDVSALKEIK